MSQHNWSKASASRFSFSRGDYADGKSPFLKILMDAEAAANSAAIHLVSFKDAMEDEFAVSIKLGSNTNPEKQFWV